MKRIREIIIDNINLKQHLLQDDKLLGVIEEVISVCVDTFNNDGKILFCGNGGSAADAQHLAAELSGRFYFDREPLPAEALHVNTSFLTAVANDYSYDEVYARMVRAMGKQGDILFGLSTSGNSGNVIRAFDAAHEKGMITIGMTGIGGGKMKEKSNYLIEIPSKDTPRIQESHIMIGHVICELIETNLFSE
jgi:D-sedoheptulose 7-phosphate isomerase